MQLELYSFDFVIGSKAVDCLMDSKWASGKGGAEILFTDRVSVELYLDRWAEHEIVMWTITVEPQYFKLGCSAIRKTWNTWNIYQECLLC